MKKILFAATISAISLFAGCNSPQKPTNSANNEAPIQILDGKKLWERNCNSCHGPGTLSAPTMAQIQTAYGASTISKSDFSNQMLQYLQAPSKENSKMPEAIEKFNIMPKLAIPEQDLKKITEFVFDQAQNATESQEPSAINPDGSINYKIQGREYAMKTKAVLSKNLLGAIEQKGTEGAVGFCNTKAYPLTDSMAIALNAKIKRVSDQARNPNNVASASQKKAIMEFKSALTKGEELKPIVEESNSKFIGFYPITTNKMCLQCHGKMGSDIQENVSKKISKLYPKDQATGYGENELRGIWVVEMEK